MKLLLASAAFMVISAASGAAAEKLIFPDGLNPEEFEAQATCSQRSSRTWCLNNFQPDGGCEWDGRNGRCKDKQPDDDRMPCEGRTSRKWCTNDFQPRSGECEWRGSTRSGSCQTVEEDTPSPTPGPDERMRCSGRTTKTWCTNDFQPRSGDCRWSNSRSRCVERNGGGGGNDCDGVATSRKLDCRDYCKSRNPRSWSYSWKYDSNKYTCTCKDGKTCTSWRYEEDEDISADYFESNSADFEEE